MVAFVSYPEGISVLKSSEVERVEQILAQNVARLQASLQRASKTHSGPEEGSDAWLFLNELIDNERATLDTRFEQSGRALAEHGGKLEARISGLQSYCDALAGECISIFSEHEAGQTLLVKATARLFQLQSLCISALTRGYQSVIDQVFLERQRMEGLLEARFQVLQKINSVSNSTVDLDQTLESIARFVAESLGVNLCSIFFYDELQRVLTLRATNGPRPMGGMHYTLRLGEGYSGWVA